MLIGRLILVMGCLMPEVNNEAYELMQNLDISLRIEHLRRPIAERVGRTLEQHIERLMKLGEHGESLDKVESAIKAEELIGKVLGFYVNKTELTGKNGEALNIKLTKEIIDTDQDKTS
ncbi:MAG: terminase [Bacteroidales bacterium]|nr:terminase [Bacteroidales bacterium]